MRTGFLLLLGRNIRILFFFNFFNVCKHPSELIVGRFFENFANKFPSLSQQRVSHDFKFTSLFLKSVLPLPTYSPDLADGVFEGLQSYSRNFTRLAYSVLRKVEKRVLLLKKNLWKNYINLVKDMPIISVNLIIILM